jgi:peptidoglycan/LPS O-acetylase OafA/YrhL
MGGANSANDGIRIFRNETMPKTGHPKIEFIEGLRGVAAMQVILLHYFAAFLPVLARVGGSPHYAWEVAIARSPLFALIDGYSAVYLFFLLSGFVLAGSFTRANSSFSALLSKRFVRLFLPVCAAFVMSALLVALVPDFRAASFARSQSVWGASLYHHVMPLRALVTDGGLMSMLFGYDGSSIFSALTMLPKALTSLQINASVDPPLWTIHVEFWGSLLVLVLAFAYRRLPRPVFWMLFTAAAFVVGTSHFFLFMMGFLAYLFHQLLLRKNSRIWAVSSALMIASGLYICTFKDVGVVTLAFSWLNSLTKFAAYSDFHWQSEAGATLIFLGVLGNPWARSVFSNRLTLWLGKLSFSVYLLHFPILFTIGCAVFFACASLPYAVAFALTLVTGTLLTFGGAVIFERWIDRRAVALSKRITGDSALPPERILSGSR